MKTFVQAIHEAQDQCLERDPSVFIMGLGASDPKGIFGSTEGLAEKHGAYRCMDMPCAENGMTGIAIGAALRGMRPIMTHQRVDFSLLALDQIINNAAKWHYMFDGLGQVPLTIRMIQGRGWGQGPQHSQTLQSLFAHIPGLRVAMPSSPYDAKGMLIQAVEDNNPVIFLEHRWLYNIEGEVPDEYYTVPFGKARIVNEGADITVVAFSQMVVEAYRALEHVGDISVELIDIRTLAPLDISTILTSLKKTGKLLILDPDWKTGSFAGEIIAQVCEHGFDLLQEKPRRLTYPDTYSPTSWALAKEYYPTFKDIVGEIQDMCDRQQKEIYLETETRLDVPDKAFTGPF